MSRLQRRRKPPAASRARRGPGASSGGAAVEIRLRPSSVPLLHLRMALRWFTEACGFAPRESEEITRLAVETATGVLGRALEEEASRRIQVRLWPGPHALEIEILDRSAAAGWPARARRYAGGPRLGARWPHGSAGGFQVLPGADPGCRLVLRRPLPGPSRGLRSLRS